jgi:hypothetical protein
MNLKQLIDQVEKIPKNECWISLEDIASEVGLSYYGGFELHELKCYFTKANWICTDTRVGIRAYYLNNELVVISAQQGRKCEEEFEWVSKESFENIRNLVLELVKKENAEPILVKDWDVNIDSWLKE